MRICKRRFSQLQIISLDEQHFEVHDIVDVVAKQSFECSLVVVALVFLPEEYGEVAVHVFEAETFNAELPLAALESAFVTQAAQNISQVEVRLFEPDSEGTLDERNVEALAIISNENFVVTNIPGELSEVLSLHVGTNMFTVVESDGGDFIVRRSESGGFDIEIGNAVTELGKNSPMQGGRQSLREE